MPKKAFTLIELLVVISIIALMIAILLPALGAAREASRTVLCLTNLRQIGVGMMAYENDHHDSTPPYRTVSNSNTKAHWGGILGYHGYIPTPTNRGAWNGGQYPYLGPTRGPFFCPNASASSWNWATPTSHLDQLGGTRWGMYYDPPNWSVGAPTRYGSDVTYGINGDDPGGQGVAPFRSLNLDTLNTLPKVTSFIRPSKLVLVYDGVYSLWSSTNGNNTIHARHNSHTTTNLLLADGHASTMPTDTLPPDNNSVFSLPALNAASPNPFWRNDQ